MGSFRMYRSEDATLKRLLLRGERIGLFRDPPPEGTVSSGTSFRLGAREITPIAGHLDVVAQEIAAAAVNLTERELKNNPRNQTDYPYRPERGNRMKYRQRFDIEAIYGTRPGVRVANKARTAAFVEFGNRAAADGEGYINAKPGKWMKLPIKQTVGQRLFAMGVESRGANPGSRIAKVESRSGIKIGKTRFGKVVVVLKKGSKYYILRRRVRAFDGYGILTRATIEGVRNARILLGIK